MLDTSLLLKIGHRLFEVSEISAHWTCSLTLCLSGNCTLCRRPVCCSRLPFGLAVRVVGTDGEQPHLRHAVHAL